MDIDPVALGQVLVSITVFAIVVHAVLGIVAYLIYFERKISAYIQDRIGYRGEPFKAYKFRTMQVSSNPPAEKNSKKG